MVVRVKRPSDGKAAVAHRSPRHGGEALWRIFRTAASIPDLRDAVARLRAMLDTIQAP
ncbi:MAG: hypothetical protein FJ029_10030 [Actinobacteria bacterium]|nr:hypothetical protein [Actinomycetota bacterium]